MSIFMTKSHAIIVIFICFLAIEKTNGFYRPLPSLLKNTLNIILHKQLEKRFGPISTSTTSPIPTTMTTTTTSSPPSSTSSELQFSSTFAKFYVVKCIKKKFKWCKLFNRKRNRHNHRILFRVLVH